MLLRVKKYSEKLLLPLAKKLKKIPANVITGLGLFFAALAFLFFILEVKLLPLIIISLALVEFFDQLDGVIARLQGPTKLGSFLDSTLDRIGDYLIFFGIILGGYTETYIGLITLAGAFLTSYTRAKIESLGIPNLYGVGLLERTDRVPIILIGSILQIWFPTAIWWTMIFLAIGTNITVIQRIAYAFKNFSTKKDDNSSS